MVTTLTLNGSETLVVRASTADRFEVDATYEPSGSRPPKHVHPHHDESFRVLAGTLRVGFAATEQDFTVGESFEIPRGTVHHMWNPGEQPATVRWLSTPAGRVEQFFTAMDRLHDDGRANLFGLAGVLSAYPDVMRPASRLTRVAVRVLGSLSRLVGR